MNQKIKMIVMDVDGTLTNGQLNIGNHGEVFKSFYCRDGLAIIRANKLGVVPVILTSRKSDIVEKRAEELGIKEIHQGLKEHKIERMKEIMKKFSLDKSQVAYIGDDINDLEAMSECGLVGCPNDAVREVRGVADYVCDQKGGYGAVREFIDWIIDQYNV